MCDACDSKDHEIPLQKQTAAKECEPPELSRRNLLALGRQWCGGGRHFAVGEACSCPTLQGPVEGRNYPGS